MIAVPLCEDWSGRDSVVKAADLHPASLGSSLWVIVESLVAAGRAFGQNCSCAPV